MRGGCLRFTAFFVLPRCQVAWIIAVFDLLKQDSLVIVIGCSTIMICTI